jgi:hypothetical protein
MIIICSCKQLTRVHMDFSSKSLMLLEKVDHNNPIYLLLNNTCITISAPLAFVQLYHNLIYLLVGEHTCITEHFITAVRLATFYGNSS